MKTGATPGKWCVALTSILFVAFGLTAMGFVSLGASNAILFQEFTRAVTCPANGLETLRNPRFLPLFRGQAAETRAFELLLRAASKPDISELLFSRKSPGVSFYLDRTAATRVLDEVEEAHNSLTDLKDQMKRADAAVAAVQLRADGVLADLWSMAHEGQPAADEVVPTSADAPVGELYTEGQLVDLPASFKPTPRQIAAMIKNKEFPVTRDRSREVYRHFCTVLDDRLSVLKRVTAAEKLLADKETAARREVLQAFVRQFVPKSDPSVRLAYDIAKKTLATATHYTLPPLP